MANKPVTAPKGMITRKDRSLFGELVTNPRGATFATQDSNEVVYIIARKHIITNIGWVCRSALYIVVPILLVSIAWQYKLDFARIVPSRYQSFIAVSYYAVVVSNILVHLANWFYNVFIVTNKRILYYTFRLFASSKVAEANLDKIEDVSQSVVGFLPLTFSYGNLFVQTAGERQKFNIESVPRVTWLRDVLVDLTNLSKNPEP